MRNKAGGLLRCSRSHCSQSQAAHFARSHWWRRKICVSPIDARRILAAMSSDQSPGTAVASSTAIERQVRLGKDLVEQSDVSTDEQAIEAWLRVHAAGSSETRRAYEREARRLLAWLVWKTAPGDQLLPLVTLQQAVAFVRWLSEPTGELVPEQALRRVGLKLNQPVKAGLGPVSLNQAVVILANLYGHLNTLFTPWGPYAPFNPFASLKSAVRQSRQPSAMNAKSEAPVSKALLAQPPPCPRDKALPIGLWKEVLATVELMPRDTAAEVDLYWQSWWILRLQWHSALRRRESVEACMSDVERTEDGYVLQVLGKGNRPACIPMSPQFVLDLRTYRLALRMSAMPVEGEHGPLIVSAVTAQRARRAHISEATLYRRVIGIFEGTAERLERLGAPRNDVQRLLEASVHGVRHTGIAHHLDAGVSLPMTSRVARHASLSQTARYVKNEERQRLESPCVGIASADATAWKPESG